MRRKKRQNLTHIVQARITQAMHDRIKYWLNNSNCRSKSEVVRAIFFREQIIWYTRDPQFDEAIAQLVPIRKEIKAIGRNINELAHLINRTDLLDQKIFYALKVAEEYAKVGEKAEEWMKVFNEVVVPLCNQEQEVKHPPDFALGKLDEKRRRYW